MPPADGITIRQKSRALFQQYRSSTAATIAGARDSYGSDNRHEDRRLGRSSRDEAFLITVNIAKLPSVPRQILKDIPRPAKFSQPGRLSPILYALAALVRAR
jgi:hypothetical protein